MTRPPTVARLSGLLLMAAVVALLISTVGVYGVTAATTAARRRELAIRAAIGADRAALIALVVRQGLIAAAIGVIVGIAGGARRIERARVGALRGEGARSAGPSSRVGLGLLAVCGAGDVSPGPTGSFGQPGPDAQRTGVIHS